MGLTAGKGDFDFLVPLGVDSVFDFLGVDFVLEFLGVDADFFVLLAVDSVILVFLLAGASTRGVIGTGRRLGEVSGVVSEDSLHGLDFFDFFVL